MQRDQGDVIYAYNNSLSFLQDINSHVLNFLNEVH